MKPYINIHTHHISKDDGVFLFNNRFGIDKSIYTETYFSIGIHPWDTSQNMDIQVSDLERYIKHPNCLAIGECGLDKTHGAELAVQRMIFESQLKLAASYQKPVIIHCVKAFDELQKIVKPYIHQTQLVVHGFNKSIELAQQLIHQGFYLSFSSMFSLKSILKKLPLDRVFFETDNQENTSIKEIYDMAATTLSLPKNQLTEISYHNFVTLFKVKPLL